MWTMNMHMHETVFMDSIFVNNSATNGTGGAIYSRRGIMIILLIQSLVITKLPSVQLLTWNKRAHIYDICYKHILTQLSIWFNSMK